MKYNVSVKRAAELLGMSPFSVQGALKAKALPIGGAWLNDNSTCYKYHISAHLLAEYLGISVEEVLGYEDKQMQA
ncbi:MAG: hypothetical protein ACLRZ7_00755 [Lachnospiraceae bacterium]